MPDASPGLGVRIKRRIWRIWRQRRALAKIVDVAVDAGAMLGSAEIGIEGGRVARLGPRVVVEDLHLQDAVRLLARIAIPSVPRARMTLIGIVALIAGG